MSEKVIRYEDNAGPATVTTPKGTVQGWACLTCNRVFAGASTDLDVARFCCATDLPCQTEGCRERRGKPWIYCPACKEKYDAARYAAFPEKDWDGETPLVLFDDDRYFFDVDEIADDLEEHDLKIEDVRFEICVPGPHPEFDMDDFLMDWLPEDMDSDVPPADINKIVNEWMGKNLPKVWVAGKMRPSLASLQAHILKSDEGV